MIKLEELTKDYGKGESCTHALRGISLTIEKGSYVSIVGTSGSGKSTLLHILGGMDTATGGKYYFDGQLVSDYSLKQLEDFRRKNISFVFQNFALMNQYSIYENVEMPLIARHIKNRKKLVCDVLERLGISEIKDKKPLKVSGGQQQRCAIARAIVSDSPVILADEPTGALDQKTGSEIIDCFEDIHKSGKTVILITHDMKVAERSERIIRIEDGRITD